MPSSKRGGARLAVDIGGTFTDIVLEARSRRWTGKVLTTPRAPEQAVMSAMRDAWQQRSPRERTILASVAAGMTTAAIGEQHWVSEHTVKFHLTNIYRQLGVSNRAGAVRYALENGLIAA